ncbi:hypothetical protein BHE74_00059084 [Ensete ventricosum]|nr:hypothetical protein BHE74_00059084 [Ensete ventricosum]
MLARATKSPADRASEVEVSEYDTAQLLHAPLMLYGAPCPRPTTAPTHPLYDPVVPRGTIRVRLTPHLDS